MPLRGWRGRVWGARAARAVGDRPSPAKRARRGGPAGAEVTDDGATGPGGCLRCGALVTSACVRAGTTTAAATEGAKAPSGDAEMAPPPPTTTTTSGMSGGVHILRVASSDGFVAQGVTPAAAMVVVAAAQLSRARAT
jgi:hypothetical protein